MLTLNNQSLRVATCVFILYFNIILSVLSFVLCLKSSLFNLCFFVLYLYSSSQHYSIFSSLSLFFPEALFNLSYNFFCFFILLVFILFCLFIHSSFLYFSLFLYSICFIISSVYLFITTIFNMF